MVVGGSSDDDDGGVATAVCLWSEAEVDRASEFASSGVNKPSIRRERCDDAETCAICTTSSSSSSQVVVENLPRRKPPTTRTAADGMLL